MMTGMRGGGTTSGATASAGRRCAGPPAAPLVAFAGAAVLVSCFVADAGRGAALVPVSCLVAGAFVAGAFVAGAFVAGGVCVLVAGAFVACAEASAAMTKRVSRASARTLRPLGIGASGRSHLRRRRLGHECLDLERGI